jgi:hypothetical protein
MKIDFSKLVVLLLPTFLRQTVLAYFVETCIKPAKVLYNDLVSWAEEKRLELATNCQICYLEAYLNYKLLGSFDRQIVIVNSDGITTDFSVVVPTTVAVDSYRLKAIVDKYKLIGKRYEVVGGTVSFQYEWENFYPEILSVDDASKWQSFYPEIVSVKKEAYINSYVRESGGNVYLSISLLDSDGNPLLATSEIYVWLKLNYSASGAASTYWSGVFNVGIGNYLSPEQITIINNEYEELISVEVESINPTSDDNYNYNTGQTNGI